MNNSSGGRGGHYSDRGHYNDRGNDRNGHNGTAEVIAVDVGSTWTKAGHFVLRDGRLSLVRRASTPTTVEHLPTGVLELVRILRTADNRVPAAAANRGSTAVPGRSAEAPAGGACPVVCSSSAKGGLSVVAVGIVPELTLAMARRTALSAGARISRVFSYELTEDDVRTIDQINPDIILLTGGTDGGNRQYVEHNSALLARLSARPHIVYAGNRAMTDRVRERLTAFPLAIAENILPELDAPNPEPARAAIREIFIRSITSGKGLDDLRQLTAEPVEPTPLVVYEFVGALSRLESEWGGICVVDLGGATTDVYTAGAQLQADGQRVVQKGPPPPDVLRTVEGDLGMRVSAPAAVESRREFLSGPHSPAGISRCAAGMSDYAAELRARPAHLPQSDAEHARDRLLAAACVTGALERHAGRQREVYTPQGPVWVQTGSDLRELRTFVGSGGFLAAEEPDALTPLFRCASLDERGRTILLPDRWRWLRDRDNLLPLLANAARRFQRAACLAAADHWKGGTP